jgi:molecular chaperone DnaK
MSKDDIDRAVREAEEHAAEDNKRREEADTRNAADQMIFQCEKLLADMGDKLSEDEKTSLGQKADALKEAVKGSDIETIKAKQDELQKALYEVSAKVYEQAAKDQQQYQQDAGAQGAAPADDGVVDADYREVDSND